VIGTEHINAALEKLNPRHDAINSVLEGFGAKEAVPYVNDTVEALGVDVDALRDFGRVQLAHYLHSGDSLELAKEKAETIILGFNIGVAAAREEAEGG
jgi:hypothetical protein